MQEQKIKALNNKTRRQILQQLAKTPQYPSQLAKKLNTNKQKIHYHIKQLKKADLIQQTPNPNQQNKATYYTTKENEITLQIQPTQKTQNFLKPLITNNELNGKIIVGSPREHGPDQVQARDGHLAGEIGLKLGKHCNTQQKNIYLDTEIHKTQNFQENLLLIGGVLTNTVTKKFNEDFPAHFSGNTFPYREITTPKNKYRKPNIGIITKTENPLNKEKQIYLIAGIRNQGTIAATKTFQNIEKHIDKIQKQKYIVTKGLDNDGDGEIDHYKVIE